MQSGFNEAKRTYRKRSFTETFYSSLWTKENPEGFPRGVLSIYLKIKLASILTCRFLLIIL